MEKTLSDKKHGVEEVPDILDHEDAMPLDIPVFTEVTKYTNFRAEYGSHNGDLVFHFFLPNEGMPEALWYKGFPKCLAMAAVTIFKLEPQRMALSYADLVQSWWFSAVGLGLAEEGLRKEVAELFIAEFDRVLDIEKANALPTVILRIDQPAILA